MKAVVLHKVKNLENMKLEEVPLPDPKTEEVLVRVKASALNHRDVWIVVGLYAKIQLPVILGSDGAGIVEKCGDKVDNRWLNKEVIINPALAWGKNPRAQQNDFRILGMPDNGTQANFLVIPAENIVEKPAYLSFEEAAAIPLGGLTGYRALFTQGQLKKDEVVLITGIGGGVATLMMKMALSIGAKVIVTSGSDEKIRLAKEQGALGGANYKGENCRRDIRRLINDKEIDLVVDSAGSNSFLDLIELVKPGGRIVCFGATAGNVPEVNLRRIFWKQITIQGTTMGTLHEFQEMVKLFKSHKIEPVIDQIFPLESFTQAYQWMIEGVQFGKIVLSHNL